MGPDDAATVDRLEKELKALAQPPPAVLRFRGNMVHSGEPLQVHAFQIVGDGSTQPVQTDGNVETAVQIAAREDLARTAADWFALRDANVRVLSMISLFGRSAGSFGRCTGEFDHFEPPSKCVFEPMGVQGLSQTHSSQPTGSFD